MRRKEETKPEGSVKQCTVCFLLPSISANDQVLEVTRHRCGTQAGADVRRLAAELSSGLSAQHNGEGPATLPPPSSPPFNRSHRAQLSPLGAIADNSVGLLTPR
ncbi:hypothetical protein Q5P01_006151 [Channa striata]|uniref:Uncharacterized protein n=1 Tax=Channa striata TaxID=64152 RepID=A0AA88T460_CHASR|nr:hypothetical protein Q5P01_006151 [Channa striata]